jgi:hypothetical protein
LDGRLFATEWRISWVACQALLSIVNAHLLETRVEEFCCARRLTGKQLKHGLQHRHVISGEEVHIEYIQRPYARQRAGLAADQCLYIGENPDEVAGAAGMAAALKKLHRDK